MNVLIASAGIGWATINVNSYPMVVELSRGGDVGKYTGFYYTASMAAQDAHAHNLRLPHGHAGHDRAFPLRLLLRFPSPSSRCSS